MGTTAALAFVALGAAVAADEPEAEPFAVVLGIAQDAGYPQAGCQKDCCVPAWSGSARRQSPASLGLVDPVTGERWLLDATPAFPSQLRQLDAHVPNRTGDAPDGIFLTHAHIGHYTGLMHLGREAMGAQGVQVWAMPRMAAFLASQGPWEQLVSLKNVSVVQLTDGEAVVLSPRVSVTPLLVPHRDEYSETVGYRVQGPSRSLLWLPDIDKWSRWSRSLRSMVQSVDLAFVDATFFDGAELPGRDMALIPHPFVVETLEEAQDWTPEERARLRLIHLNHSNPALRAGSDARGVLDAAGVQVAESGAVVPL
jgi:pyrroloquinoline quinone biosynthesis protein B